MNLAEDDPFDVLLLISKLNQIASPFLKLSAELRNEVYDFYFQDTKWLIHGKKDMQHRKLVPHAPSLLLVCAQIHSETALLPYSKGLLSVNDYSFFKDWVARRSINQANSITKLELQCALKLGDYSVSQCNLPVDRHGTLIRSFPRLKHVHLQVDVTGRSPFHGRPHDKWARTNVMNLRQSFLYNVPGVEVTIAWTTRQETQPVLVKIGDHSWVACGRIPRH